MHLCWVKVIHTAEQNLPKRLAKSHSLVALWLAIMGLERRNFDKIAKNKVDRKPEKSKGTKLIF